MPRFRNALLPLTLLLALAPRLAAAKGLAFVLDSVDATITEIDVSTEKPIRTVPVLREPHHMALTPDGKSMLVGDTSGNAIFYLDPDTGAVQRQIVAADPYQLQFSPNGKFLTVT
ncbi:MAG TPA: YncE family protein, partial [Acetobacteraceae bacterium]